jgi:hypothetical protein
MFWRNSLGDVSVTKCCEKKQALLCVAFVSYLPQATHAPKEVMFMDSKIPKLFTASSLLVAIVGCGGGGGDSGAETPQSVEPSLRHQRC